ncbi:hypothetical protein ABZ815_37575 [Nonomuraea sp. NPDC047529]|uniref:hypothetical protein n=1 Tax=Nonomuraea sp. NPDC047529 TaxID=3155623 RepID=UPI00340DB765
MELAVGVALAVQVRPAQRERRLAPGRAVDHADGSPLAAQPFELGLAADETGQVERESRGRGGLGRARRVLVGVQQPLVHPLPLRAWGDAQFLRQYGTRVGPALGSVTPDAK